MVEESTGRIVLDDVDLALVPKDVTRQKLTITIISAAMTALGGAMYGQFVMYLNPDTLAGVGVSLQIVFAAIAGGMYSMLGPTVGAVFTIVLGEALRIWFGTTWIGAANTIYGILLVIFIIYMPRGIVGLIASQWSLRFLPTRRPA